MTEFVSEVMRINASERTIYMVLEDLSNFGKIKNVLPVEQFKDLTFERDNIHLTIERLGKLTLRITERNYCNLIKLVVEGVPFKVDLYVQLMQTLPIDTGIKVIIRADLNPMLKGMLSKEILRAVNKIAYALSEIPYKDLYDENNDRGSCF
ncbi:MAG: hypothetical protein LBS54_05720 [Dysgonamonadaceae bacterium]|jgi:hypothetical protein|nr:hypothetical protein [Dysgonamonadaceae bacterium]